MMPFVKIDCSILYSSIWSESSETRIVWITMLAMADQTGLVSATAPGISSAAFISLDDTRKALSILESPDQDSKSMEYDGRRIRRVEGGYSILNYDKYRTFNYSMKKEAIRKREYRTKIKGTLRDIKRDIVPKCPGHSASASEYESESLSSKEEKRKMKNPIYAFDAFWIAYPRKVGKGAAEKAWSKIKPGPELVEKMLRALAWQRQQDQWTKDGGQFVPHPTTWLNQKRWEDEPPKRDLHILDSAWEKEHHYDNWMTVQHDGREKIVEMVALYEANQGKLSQTDRDTLRAWKLELEENV